MLGNREQMTSRLDCKLRGTNRVLPLVGDVADELGHPRIFVTAWRWIYQQRCVTPEHPAQPLDDCGRAVPDLGVARGQLPAVCERRFHRRIAMSIEDDDLMTTLEKSISGRYAGDTGSDNGNM